VQPGVLPFTGYPELQEPSTSCCSKTRSRRSRGSGRVEPHEPRRQAPHAEQAAEDRRTPELEHELVATKEYLQSLIEEHGRTNDDLGSANEELVSGTKSSRA
jgi:two-component system CheB/CheR fusion protein